MKMIKAGRLMSALLLALPAGCARPAAGPAGVPSGCDPEKSTVGWSDIAREPVLEHVSLFTGDVLGEGRAVLDAPVIAAVTGLDVPDTWLRILAAKLADDTNTDIQIVRPSEPYEMGFGTWGAADSDITESIVYSGVGRISATFTIACSPAVSGTFTAWTETKTGGLMCGDRTPPNDPYQQAARKHCPRTPQPLPSDEPIR
ncbi:hypothetical protein Q0Z83_037260 [Actinoplanes sichuanensis]|uniref:Uncharacterized protein n=1 Tax=Actinoplanes sichuanensis TaxID=512349 RepID=A0ABW4A3K4_9ACTN|nr:hypothetical protein [Actinoplanes sichuanensis]BEL05535.1 hypothetical protein Q0Z83_037260 [Actinoplanes sichuanensis]